MAQKLFDKASLVNIPSQYKDGKLYNIKPEDQSSSFEFSRGSAATRVNADGLIENLYDEATNLLLQSNQFDTTWTSIGTTETGGQIGYDGSNNAWRLDTTASGSAISQNVTSTGVQTFSVKLKQGTLGWASVQVSGTSGAYVYFNLINGVKGLIGPAIINSNITSVGNGYYLCSITFNGSAGAARVFPAVGNGDVSATSGNIYIQDAQLEAGYVATPYIETTTAPVTRPNQKDTPRIDYSTGEGALLLEPQRSNLVTNSSNISSFSLFRVTTELSDVEFLDGTLAYKVNEDNTNQEHYVNRTNIQIASGYNVASCFVKSAENKTCRIQIYDGTAGINNSINFDLENKTYSTATASAPITSFSASIEEFSNGWFRICFIFQSSVSSTSGQFRVHNSSNGFYQGDGASGIYLSGVQFEQGSYPTSYIPTYGTVETRLADICVGGGDASLFNNSGGTIYVEASTENNSTFNALSASDGTQTNRLTISATADNKIRFIWASNGSVTYTDTDLLDLSANHKIALAWSGTGYYKGYVDSKKYQNTTISSTTMLFDSIDLHNAAGASNFYGNVKALHYFPEALSDGYLQVLTSNANITAADSDKFIITVKTDNLSTGSSGATQFTLPWIGTDYSIETSAGHAISGLSGSYTLDFPEAGTYDVAVTAASGTIRFANGGDKAKLLDIKNWGAVQWTSLSEAFRGCSNTVITAVDTPDLSIATSIFAAFLSTSSITSVDVSKWNVSGITDFGNLFRDSALTSIDVSNWDTSSATVMSSMFRSLINLKADFAGLDINSVTTFNDFATSTNINETGTTTNYDNTLISWAAQTPRTGININFGTAKYSWRAIEARNTLVNDYNWTITDGGITDDDEFVITVRTTTSAETFTIPTTGGGYSYDVDWGDGTSSVGQTGNATHEYATAGDYDIQITGTFPRIFFNNTGDKAKLIDIKNWGNGAWTSMDSAFWGCTNLSSVSAEDIPVLSSLTTLKSMFFGCTSLTTLNASSWNTSTVTILYATFYNCTSLIDLDVRYWDINQVTDFRFFASGVTISTATYDQILINWEAQSPLTNRTIDFGGSKFTLGSAAETARTSLRNTFGWTITDGGGVSGVLNQYTGAAAAYSLRNLNKTYYDAGLPLIRVRADLGGTQPEQDFTYDEIMDGTLATFVGAGNNGYVVTWYDQSGLGNHATQGTASNQPQIVASGVVITENGMPAVDYDGIDDFLQISNLVTQLDLSPFSIFTASNVGKYGATAAMPRLYLDENLYSYNNLNIINWNATLINYATRSYFAFSNNTHEVFQNGISKGTASETLVNFATNDFLIGRSANNYSSGNIQEVIIYTSDQSSNRTNIEGNINGYYSIY